MQEFKQLRGQFAQFTNLYQFPLISHQQQMIEMYQIARQQMQVDELFAEIQSEINDTHQFFDAMNAAKLNRRMFWLTVVASVVGLGGLAVSLVTLITP